MKDSFEARNETTRMWSLSGYLLLTFFISWACFVAGGVISANSPASPIISGSLYLLGAIMPGVIALKGSCATVGWSDTAPTFARIFWPTRISLLIFAATYFAIVKLVAAVLHNLITGSWPEFGDDPIYMLLGAILISTPIQAGEEIGWRGFVLPLLAKTIGLGGASIILGIIWALWHLPFFFIEGVDTFGQSFVVYLLQVTAISIAMAWLYWRSNWNLLIVMVLHAAINNAKDVVPSAVLGAADSFAVNASLVGWLTLGVLWAASLWFMIDMKGAAISLKS